MLIALIVSGCGVRKNFPVVQVKDSVRVEYRTELMVVRDTAWVEIPKESEKVVTIDTASFLENRFAESYAVIADGMLFHSLETKPQKIAAPVETVVQVKDTIVWRDCERVVEVPVEVQKMVVPGWCRWLLFVNISIVLCMVYLKFRK